MQKAALYTSGVIFAAVSFTHLARLIPCHKQPWLVTVWRKG